MRRIAIEHAQDTIGSQISHALFPQTDTSKPELLQCDQAGISEPDEQDTRCSFVVNARLAVVDP